MITIDGSRGEGGGQILRTSLALSLVTGTAFRIERVRARRERPGLLRQHLTAVQAAAALSGAAVEGAALHSRQLVFRPGRVAPGEYHFAVGTAGSAGLVLQTVLPALLCAGGPSRLLLEGGTHNPGAPPYDFLVSAFLPLVERMGTRVTPRLHRPGFYPAGGGSFEVDVDPSPKLAPLELEERGELCAIRVRALLARLPRHVAERELEVIRREGGWRTARLEVVEVDSAGPGNALVVEVDSERVGEVFTAFGARGVRAEEVARSALVEARRYLDAGVAVGEHLADQLLVPLAVAGGGSFLTLMPTLHFTTNAEVIRHFLDVHVTTNELGPDRWRVRVEAA